MEKQPIAAHEDRVFAAEACRHGAMLFTSEKLDPSPSWEELEPGTLAVARPDLSLNLHHV